METASSRPQTATEILMDTQTEIKDLIMQALFNVTYMIGFNERVKKLLDKNLAEIENEQLRQTTREALERYARNEYRTMINMLNFGNLAIFLGFSAYNNKEINLGRLQADLSQSIQKLGKADINKAFSQLGNSQAMVSYSQSVYSHSELALRHERQTEMLSSLKQKTNLVICDTHSDCSTRCFPWQGKIYSLDGTSGTTDDGRSYQPLENATDVYVTSKSGRTWKNGLLGFNCRHKLVPYKRGLKPNKVTKEEQQREKAISNQQREFERQIRRAKDQARTFANGAKNTRSFDKQTIQYMQEKAKQYRQRATSLNEQYVEFCRKYGRVEYRSRLQI